MDRMDEDIGRGGSMDSGGSLRNRLREGMIARSMDGERLGKIVDLGSDTFTIEKGFFFKTDYIVRYEHVSDVANEEVTLSLDRIALEGDGHIGNDMALDHDRDDGGTQQFGVRAHEEGSVTLHEEELEARKTTREAGRVRVSKQVRTEEKQITVPVREEEITIERTAGREGAPIPGDAFQEKTLEVPLMKEEIEVTKRPVVRENVRVRKDVRERQQTASGTVRREELDVEESGEASINEDDDRYKGGRMIEDDPTIQP